MQVTPVDATPGWVNALGGAGGAYRGFMQAKALTQQLENDNKRLKLQQDEAERRGQLAGLAEQELRMQYDQFQAKQQAEAGKRAGNQALNQATLLGQMGMSNVEGVGGGFDAIGDEGMAELPPEWGQSFKLLQDAAQSGEVEPKDFASAVHELGKMQGGILREKAGDELFQQIQRDVAPGVDGTSFWGRHAGQQQQSADGKPQPSPFDEFVDGIATRLEKGEDPLILAQEYQAKRALADEEYNSKRALAFSADDFRKRVILPNQAASGPTVTGKMMSAVDAYERGDYGTGDAAMRRLQLETGQAIAGTKPIAIGGKIVHVEERDYESIMGQLGRLEDKSKEPPEISILTPFAKMVGEFRYNPDDTSADFEQQHARWMKAVRTTRDEFMGGGQQAPAPGGTIQPPPLIRNGAQPNQAPPGNSPPAVQPGQAPPRNVPTWDTANESQRSALTRMLDRASDADARAIRNDPALQAFIDSMPEDEFRKLVPKKKAASPPDRGSNGGGSK